MQKTILGKKIKEIPNYVYKLIIIPTMSYLAKPGLHKSNAIIK